MEFNDEYSSHHFCFADTVVAVGTREKVPFMPQCPIFSRVLQVAKAAFSIPEQGIILVSDVYMRKQLKIPILAEVFVNVFNLLNVLKLVIYW